MTPEVRLASAVLHQCVLDLFLKASAGAHKAHTDSNPTVEDKKESLAFLTATEGPYAAMREHWCTIAGRDAEQMRRSIIEFLEGNDSLIEQVAGYYSSPSRAHILAESVAQVRELWAARTAMTDEARKAWLAAAARRKEALLNANARARAREEAAERERAKRAKQVAGAQSLEDDIKTICGALLDGPLRISQIAYHVEKGREALLVRLDEAANRRLVRKVPGVKGTWELVNQGSNGSLPHSTSCNLKAS